MKILFTRFPLESRLGGAEVQTVSLMEGLMARGHAVAFAGSCPVLLRLCREKHIPVVEWHVGPPPVTKFSAISFLWRKGSMRASLQTLLKQFSDIDAVCMLSMTEKLLLTDIAARQKRKILWIEHDRIGRWLIKNPWLPLLRRQSAQARIVTVSDMSKALMTDTGFDGNRITAIPNGIDASRFAMLPERRKDDMFTVGCIARLTPDKGVPVLTEALRHVPDVFLTIVGEGEDRSRIPKDKNIRIWPSVDNVGAFYREIDVLVLPSVDNDPFGMVAAEAMLCDTPVVVTDQCGIAGYLEHGKDALIVRANDVAALASALTRLQDEAVRREIGLRGQKTAQKRFAIDTMIDAYESLLNG